MGWFDDFNPTDILSGGLTYVDRLTGGHAWDFLTGNAAKDAAEAAAQSQEAQAEAYRTQAKETLGEGKAALENYVTQSNRSISSVVNRVAAAGGIGFKQTETASEGSTGVNVGSEDSQAITDAKGELKTALGSYASVDEMQSHFNDLSKRITELKDSYFLTDEDRSELFAGQKELSGLGESLKKVNGLQDKLNSVTGTLTKNDLSAVPDVMGSQSSGAKFATGSTLRNLSTFRDELQKARNTYARGIQSDVFSLLTSGKTYDAAAAASRKAGEIARWDTILGRGLQIGGLALAL